jgi:trigger factor
MRVTQEKLPASQVGLEIEVSPEMSRKAYEEVIGKFMRSAQIPGFRKGKVPRQVVLQRFGSDQIKATVVEELIQDALKQAITQENIEAIGNFQLRSSFDELIGQFSPGEHLTFSAAVDVRPEAKLGQYTNLKVQVKETQLDPARVEAVLAEHQTERATLIPVEGRPAQPGDVAVVDFSGRLVKGGEAESEVDQEIPGGQAEDFQIELVEGRFIEGFVDGIMGMNVGETKELPVVFPENYPQEDLAGRSAVFTVTLKEIKEKELPTLNDDFAQEISEFQTLAELRSFLEEQFQTEAKQQTEADTQAALLDELLKVLEVEIPETLITNEVNHLLTQTATHLQRQGVDIKQLFTEEVLPEMRERSRPEAITRIKRTLALAEVAKNEAIEVEPQEVEERVQSLIEQYSNQDQKIDREKLQEIVEGDLLEEKVMQWLIEHSQVELGSEEAAQTLETTATEVTETSTTGELEPGEEQASNSQVSSADQPPSD